MPPKYALLIVLALLCGTARMNAQPPDEYTRFLVPVYVPDTPGAYGSLWRVRTWLRYSGSELMRMVPTPFCYAIECTLRGPVLPGRPSVPFQRLAGFPEPAILVHIQTPHASEVTFESRLQDISRSTDGAGTEVPVVREDQIRNAPVYLLNVPIDARFRSMVRVFALPEIPDPEVEIRYFKQPDDSGTNLDTNIYLLRVDRVRLRTRPSTFEWNLYPSLAEVPNVETFSELADQSRIWLEIVPLTTGLRIWALMSITNNDTQQVTIISPHQ